MILHLIAFFSPTVRLVRTIKIHMEACRETEISFYADFEICSTTRSSGARCSSVVRAFAHGAMGRRIDPSWGGPIELFLFPASAPRLV